MEPMIAALLRPDAYDPAVERVELLQTHISWILLAGPFAYKIKKPVNLGFVDFATAERRRWFCSEELRLNRRLAPDLYIDLAPVHGPADRASFHGDGPVLEVAVRMHRFPPGSLLSDRLGDGELPVSLFDRLADDLAAFHAAAAVAPPETSFGDPETVGRPAFANLEVLADCAGPGAGAQLSALRDWTESEHRRLLAVFAERRVEGRVRECHGDLHLGNMALHHGRIVVFDCLEFSPSLRWIDVVSDMAFLAMDLQQRGHRCLAVRVLNRWLEHGGDYTGLLTWRWYVVYRALVRAKVTALRMAQADLDPGERRQLPVRLAAYLAFAGAVTRHDRPALLITHGVSGSGKSHLAQRLTSHLGWIHLRSDVERKRLFGLWGSRAGALLEGDPYRPEVTRALYHERLRDCATAILAAGFSLIVDATFLLREQRRSMEELAGSLGARYMILDVHCPEALARRRIEARLRAAADPSDADGAVLEGQLAGREPLSSEEGRCRLEVDGGIEDSGADDGGTQEELGFAAVVASLEETLASL
jgi:aminoglycoside phosphotransferase family enzyme/predicted kinase